MTEELIGLRLFRAFREAVSRFSIDVESAFEDERFPRSPGTEGLSPADLLMAYGEVVDRADPTSVGRALRALESVLAQVPRWTGSDVAVGAHDRVRDALQREGLDLDDQTGQILTRFDLDIPPLPLQALEPPSVDLLEIPSEAGSERSHSALESAWSGGVPLEATALYGRWWQLETWIRTLAYLELRAAYGLAWDTHLPQSAEQREAKDRAFGDYMATPDAHHRLAYLDTTPLLRALVDGHWDKLSYALPGSGDVWMGRAQELLRIRHRIGHCRRPHTDDLDRMEQTLRDLEPGAQRALSAVVARDPRLEDTYEELDHLTLIQDWHHRRHVDAHLVDHAAQRYGIHFDLRWSQRPWVSDPPAAARLGSGYLWHASWYARDGGGWPSLSALWDDLQQWHHDRIVYLFANDPHRIEILLAASDDQSDLSPVIGHVFNRLCEQHLPDVEHREWLTNQGELDARIQISTPWSLAADLPEPFPPIFGAQRR